MHWPPIGQKHNHGFEHWQKKSLRVMYCNGATVRSGSIPAHFSRRRKCHFSLLARADRQPGREPIVQDRWVLHGVEFSYPAEAHLVVFCERLLLQNFVELLQGFCVGHEKPAASGNLGSGA